MATSRYLQAKDINSGQEAQAIITIKNPATSQLERYELFSGRNLTATSEIKQAVFRTLGKRGDQYKTTGWSGSGTVTIYAVTSMWKRLLQQYDTTGILPSFDILVTNHDPASATGKEVKILKDCSLTRVDIAKFDVDNEGLDEQISFNYASFELQTEYNEVIPQTV